jgi:hypothetical protein
MTGADIGTTIGLKRDGLLWRDLDGEVVVLDLGASTYFSLNVTGSLLWHQLDQPSTIDALVKALADDYGLQRFEAERDVYSFLDTLEAHGLIERL